MTLRNFEIKKNLLYLSRKSHSLSKSMTWDKWKCAKSGIMLELEVLIRDPYADTWTN